MPHDERVGRESNFLTLWVNCTLASSLSGLFLGTNENKGGGKLEEGKNTKGGLESEWEKSGENFGVGEGKRQ